MTQAPAPPATTVTVAQTLIRYLRLEGCDHVFGIPGGGLANLLVEFKNQRADIKYVICRHESGAAYAADGYSRTTGRLGVVMTTSGPGATNAVTGVMNADNDGSSVLAITGEVGEEYFGKGYLQEGTDIRLDVDALFGAAVASSAMITLAGNAQELIEQAMRVTRATPGRAAHLSIPDNISVETLNPAALAKTTANYRSGPGGIATADVQRIAEALSQAKRPVIFLGNGCRKALADPATMTALCDLVERYQIPVMTTADAKGIFPESHPLSLRVYGFASCQWPQYWLLPQRLDPKAPPYDALLIVASALGGLATGNWNPMLEPAGPTMQVDVDAQALGRGLPLEFGVVGEASVLFAELPKAAAACTWNEADIAARKAFVARIKKTCSPFVAPKDYSSKAKPIRPPALVRVLQETLPKDAIIMLDCGNSAGWGAHYFVIDPPSQIHSSLAMGPMGFAVGAVLGAKLGNPSRTCLAVTGDGAFLMFGNEVSTAQHYRIGAIWVVLQDNDLHMVTQGMTVLYPDKTNPDVYDDLYTLGRPDLVKVAEGLGADAYGIGSPAALADVMPKVLAAAAKGRPQVVVARIATAPIPPYYNPDYKQPG